MDKTHMKLKHHIGTIHLFPQQVHSHLVKGAWGGANQNSRQWIQQRECDYRNTRFNRRGGVVQGSRDEHMYTYSVVTIGWIYIPKFSKHIACKLRKHVMEVTWKNSAWNALKFQLSKLWVPMTTGLLAMGTTKYGLVSWFSSLTRLCWQGKHPKIVVCFAKSLKRGSPGMECSDKPPCPVNAGRDFGQSKAFSVSLSCSSR